MKRERTLSLDSTVLSLTIDRQVRTTDDFMIRFFSTLCKSLLNILDDDKSIFQNATNSYSYKNEPCKRCGAKGRLISYGDYIRNFVYLINKQSIDSRIRPQRFLCKSCNATHALLPDIIIPYSPYSLRFMLEVLIAYYERANTVVEICEGFHIAVSTLYEWKKRIESHKELLLGILVSQKTPALAFLRGLIKSSRLSDTLHTFFNKYGFSFMQNQSPLTSQCHPP